MIITKPMVCDILSAYNIVEYIAEDTAQAFEKVEFITGCTNTLVPSVLYVATAEQLKKAACPELDGLCVVCQGSGDFAEEFTGAHRVNLLLFPESADFFQVANELLAGISSLNS